MQSLTLSDLSHMLLKGSNRVIEHKEHINAINVFPVPDSDTGSNMGNTCLGIQKILTGKTFTDTDACVTAVLDAALAASQGNSGILLVSYLQGFLTVLQGKETSYLQDFATAVQQGATSARQAVGHPVSGTMLDVMDAFAESTKTQKDGSLQEIFSTALQQARVALINTEKNMKLLEEHHVVDAGALGFLFFLHGMYEGLTGEWIAITGIHMQPVSKQETIDTGKFPFEVIFTVTDAAFSREQLKDMFHSLGDSLDIIVVQDKIKVHIHTDVPDVVKETAVLTGTVITLDVVDMRIAPANHTHI